MGARIVFALLLLFQSLPLAALGTSSHCHEGATDGDHCPFHAKPATGDHCARAAARHEHPAAGRSSSAGGIHAPGCDCQHGAPSAMRGAEPFLEIASADARGAGEPKHRLAPWEPLGQDAATTPPTPPPRTLSV